MTQNIHPEVAEPMIVQMLGYYVMAGQRVGLAPDWVKFKASETYEKACQKYKKEAVDKQLDKFEALQQFPPPQNYGIAGSDVERVIRDYVNLALIANAPINWEDFRASQFYPACVLRSKKEDVDKAIAEAKAQTDKLNTLC